MCVHPCIQIRLGGCGRQRSRVQGMLALRRTLPAVSKETGSDSRQERRLLGTCGRQCDCRWISNTSCYRPPAALRRRCRRPCLKSGPPLRGSWWDRPHSRCHTSGVRLTLSADALSTVCLLRIDTQVADLPRPWSADYHHKHQGVRPAGRQRVTARGPAPPKVKSHPSPRPVPRQDSSRGSQARGPEQNLTAFTRPPAGRCRRHDECTKEVQTKALDVSVGDDAGGEAEEGFVDVVASFPSDAQADALPPNGKRPGQSRVLASFGDDRVNAALPQQAPVLASTMCRLGSRYSTAV